MKRTVKQIRDAIADLDEKFQAAVKRSKEVAFNELTEGERNAITGYHSARGELAEEERVAMVVEQEQVIAARSAGGMGNGAASFSANDERDLRTFSMFRGMQILADKRELDGVEKEVHDMAKREAAGNGVKIEGFAVPAFLGQNHVASHRGQTATGQTATPGDQGGVLVETQVNELIEALWSKNWLSKVNAVRLAGLQGNIRYPVQKTKPVAQEVAEIEKLTKQEILFSELDMAPKRRGATIPISKQLLLQTSYDVQKMVIDQIRRSLDLKMNLDALIELQNAVTTANGNLIDTTANGRALTYADIVNLEGLIAMVDADADNMSYLINSKTRNLAKLTRKFGDSVDSSVIWEPGNTLNGYKAVVSNVLPSNKTKGTGTGLSDAYFGDFSSLVFGTWGGTDIVVDPYTLADEAQVKITVNMFWDMLVTRKESFAGIKGIVTTVN